MTAILTVDQNRNHILLSCRVVDLSHACILPRIFDSISENDILSGDIKATISIDVILDFRFSNRLTENCLAVGDPIRFVNELGPHGMIRVSHLEPSEFGAVLPGPLPHVILVIHFGI